MTDLSALGEKLKSNYTNTSRLKDGIAIQDLVTKMSTEFTLDSNFSDIDDPFSETSSEKLNDFEGFEPYVDLDSLAGNEGEATGQIDFDEIKLKMSPVTEDGKILKMILRKGSGSSIPPLAVVYYHYNSYLHLDPVPFDSSYLRNHNPVRNQVGVGSMFRGFETSLMTMNVGEKSRFLVEPEYAFGKLGAPPRIPPNATILLEIEVLKIVDCGVPVEETTEMSEKSGVSFEECYKNAKAYHLLANEHFNSKRIVEALQMYKKAEKELIKCSMNSDDEEHKYLKLLLKIYTNLCICYNHPKIGSPEQVCVTAREARYTCHKLVDSSPKLFFNLAKAQVSLNDLSGARKNLKKAYNLEPQNKEINVLLKEIEVKEKFAYEEEKIRSKRALGLYHENENKKSDDITSTEYISEENNEQYEEFRKTMLEELQEFSTSRRDQLDLPAGFTKAELQICNKVCRELGLKLVNRTICGRKLLHVSKK